jgi:hypothetical protein
MYLWHEYGFAERKSAGWPAAHDTCLLHAALARMRFTDLQSAAHPGYDAIPVDYRALPGPA